MRWIITDETTNTTISYDSMSDDADTIMDGLNLNRDEDGIETASEALEHQLETGVVGDDSAEFLGLKIGLPE